MMVSAHMLGRRARQLRIRWEEGPGSCTSHAWEGKQGKLCICGMEGSKRNLHKREKELRMRGKGETANAWKGGNCACAERTAPTFF